VGRVGEEMLGRTDFNDGSFIHENHPVGHLPGESHLMGDHYHGHAFLCQGLHNIQHFSDHFRVQGRGRLIEQHDFGIHGQRPGDGHPLLLATR